MQLRRRIVPTPEHPSAEASNPVATWLELGTWHVLLFLAKGSATGILLHVKVERGGGVDYVRYVCYMAVKDSLLLLASLHIAC
jgi:hypothetical protein